MSSHAKRSKLFCGCALALSGLLLNPYLPSVFANDSSVDDWITDSGAAKPTSNLDSKTSSQKSNSEPENDSTESGAVASEELPAKKIAQALPPSVAAAVNAAALGSTPSAPVLKGGVTYCVPSGTPLKLKLATVPVPELKSEMRDMEGKLSPAQMDQEITAKITEDIYVDDNKVIPEGTIFHGRVSKIYAPRHVGRPGHLEISFDRFSTPDGRKFAFRAEADNFKESTVKSKAKGLGIIAAHAAGGAAVGALVVYKVLGWQEIIAMHGYPLAGGAAVGAVGGIAWALWRRGDQAVLEPGDEFNMSIDKDLLIPAAVAPAPKVPKLPSMTLNGFDMEVTSKKVARDGLGGHVLRIDAVITNNSKYKLSSIDLFLEDDLGVQYPVTVDEAENAEELFYVQPYSRQRIICAFAIEFPKLKHKLVWLDHNTHKKIFEQKL